MAKKYYRCGYAPYVVFGPLYENRKECAERAKTENKIGDYKGRGVKVVQTNEDGRIVIKNEER
jgi:hypothetical protein